MTTTPSPVSRGLLLVSTAMLTLSIAGAALGQDVPTTPSQLMPGESAVIQGPDALLTLPEIRGLQAPQGAAQTRLTLAGIALEGGVEAINARAETHAPAPGTHITLDAVYAYASRLQQLYFESGYPLVRVTIPAQDIDAAGATIRVMIVNGYVDRIDTSALPGRVEGQVARMLAPLLNNTLVSAEELERRVLLAGDTAGLALRSAITPGQQTGAVTLVLTGEHRPVNAVLSVDNRLVEASGREQLTASVALNSYFGAGEQLLLTAATSLNDPGFGNSAQRSYLSASASRPVGVEGWSLSLYAIHAASTPEPTLPGVVFDGEFFRIGVSTSYALKRSRTENITLSLAADASYEDQDISLAGLTAPLFADRTRAVRASITGTQLRRSGELGYDAQLSRGIAALGARTRDDASPLRPLSRDGADADFTRLAGGVNFSQTLAGGLQFRAGLRGQTSFNAPLLRSEQTSILAPGLISAPPGGLVTGDRMIAGRLELQTRYSPNENLAVQPFVAFAAGESRLERPTALERTHSAAYGPSAGVRASFGTPAGPAFSAQVEWTRLNSNDQRLSRDWFGFTLALRY